jgi:AcrR family transcriptional regulator
MNSTRRPRSPAKKPASKAVLGSDHVTAKPSGRVEVDTSRSDPKTARRARRERRRERSREEILEAARSVILDRGIAGATLDAVAREVGMSKASLYYYFPSKDALLFELVYGVIEGHARKVHDAVAETGSGGAALRAIIRATVDRFAPHLDDFRLAFLHGQVAAQGSVHFDEEQFARIRPLNELWFQGAARKLRADSSAPARQQQNDDERRSGRNTSVDPRLMAFLAYTSAIGLLTFKGAVESMDDPLLYSDEQLVEGLARIFEAAVLT